MGLFRLILIVAIVWLVYMLVMKLGVHNRSKSSPADGEGKRMVACKQCGLHIPIDEALQRGEEYFCSEEHRDRS